MTEGTRVRVTKSGSVVDGLTGIVENIHNYDFDPEPEYQVQLDTVPQAVQEAFDASVEHPLYPIAVAAAEETGRPAPSASRVYLYRDEFEALPEAA